MIIWTPARLVNRNGTNSQVTIILNMGTQLALRKQHRCIFKSCHQILCLYKVQCSYLSIQLQGIVKCCVQVYKWNQ